jgi:SAM-dependent methyltransferase
MTDPRAEPARFYDLAPDMPHDVPFYLARLPSPGAHVLELGCGTGRVTAPLAQHCAFVHGIDHSEAMLRICRGKLKAAGVTNAEILLGDIADFRLEHTFDFIIAPYRVLQNLETDSQVQGLFSGIRRHLRPGGRCILNTFGLQQSRAELIARWSTPEESLDWEVPIDGGRVACYARRLGIDVNPLVLHPELVYRVYRGDELIEEVRHRFAMRCYYPDELVDRIRGEGFRVTATFGGYDGQAYGTAGTDQVVEFEAAA